MVEDHKHCIVCGKPTDPEKTICSTACGELMKQQQKKAGRSRMLMLILFIVMFAVIMLMSALTPAPKAP